MKREKFISTHAGVTLVGEMTNFHGHCLFYLDNVELNGKSEKLRSHTLRGLEQLDMYCDLYAEMQSHDKVEDAMRECHIDNIKKLLWS